MNSLKGLDTPKLVLIGVGVVAVLVAAGALVMSSTDMLKGAFGKKDEVPTLMIISQGMLDSRVEAASVIADYAAKADGKTPETGATAAEGKDPIKPSSKGTPSKNAANDLARGSAEMKQVSDALQDSLGGSVGEDIEASGRFRLISHAAVVEAMSNYEKAGKGSILSQIPGLARKSSSSTSTTTTDPKGKTNLASQDESTIFTHGLTEVGKTLNADYVMIVTIGEPQFSRDIIDAGDGTHRLQFSAQPLVRAELYDSRTGREIDRFSELLPQPIRESLPWEDGTPLAGHYLDTSNKFLDRLHKAVSQMVLARTLNKIAPARVTRSTTKEIVINRGSNDGVAVGDVMDVERETGDTVREGGDASGKGGHDLDKVREPVGSIRVERVQERISVVSVASGGPIKRDDVVILPTFAVRARAPGAAAASGQDGDIPLGSQGLDQEAAAKQAGVAMRQATVAVDNIMLRAGGQPVFSLTLARTIASTLQEDARIKVLPRADLDRIRAERSFNAASNGEYGESLMEGMATSGYLVTGEFQSSSQSHSNSVSVMGQRQVVSTSTSTTMSATLRATSVKGVAVASVTVSQSGGSLDDLARTASRQLLLKLFPISVVQVTGDGVVRVNRGADVGIRVGSRIHIYSLGEKIVDPQTGALLSSGARTLVGDVVVFQVDPNIASAHVEGAAFPVAVGYAAELATGAPPPPAGAAAAGPPRARPAAGKSRAKAEPQGAGDRW